MQTKIVIPNTNSPRFLLWIGFILSIINETLINIDIIPDNEIVKIIQYLIILLPIALNLIPLIHRGKYTLFYDELKSGIILIIVLGILSIFKSFHAGIFSFESIMQLIQIILPFLYAYLMINLFNANEIDEFIVFSLVCTWIGYIADIGITQFFNLSNYSAISYLTSFSAFENSIFAEIASGLGAYCIYNFRRKPFLAILSLALNLFIFKRVFVLMAVVLFVICLLKKENDLIKEKSVVLTGFFWCIAIFATYLLYQPFMVQIIHKKLGVNLVAFTMSRVYRLWYVMEQNFQSYGLGSTSIYISSSNLDYLGAEFEMDFIRIMFEIGPLAIIAIVFTYLKIIRRNKYSFFLICFCFLNLLMANGLVRYWGWAMRLITIAIINNYDGNMNRIAPVPYRNIKSVILNIKSKTLKM